MSARRHTPGPWRTCPEDWRVIEDRDGLVLADMTTGSEQDARLIAAAPDLLEAAQRMLPYFYPELCRSDPEHDDLAIAAHERLVAAIDKATVGEGGEK